MTTSTNTARVAATAQNTEADKVLRDVAFILKLTRRVKEEMTADRAQTQVKTVPADRTLVA
ncbi:MAG TPA: hypothetical protein VGE74_08870 [Gemmata sp.]